MPIVVRPVWLTSAPVRLLPIRLTRRAVGERRLGGRAGDAAGDGDVSSSRSGRPMIWTCSVVAGGGVDELEHVVVHQERCVGQRERGLVLDVTAAPRVVERVPVLVASTSGSRPARPGRTAAG